MLPSTKTPLFSRIDLFLPLCRYENPPKPSTLSTSIPSSPTASPTIPSSHIPATPRPTPSTLCKRQNNLRLSKALRRNESSWAKASSARSSSSGKATPSTLSSTRRYILTTPSSQAVFFANPPFSLNCYRIETSSRYVCLLHSSSTIPGLSLLPAGLRNHPDARSFLPRRGEPPLVGHSRSPRLVFSRRCSSCRASMEHSRPARERRS